MDDLRVQVKSYVSAWPSELQESLFVAIPAYPRSQSISQLSPLGMTFRCGVGTPGYHPLPDSCHVCEVAEK